MQYNLHYVITYLAVRKVDNTLQWRNLAVLPETNVFWSNSTFGSNGRCFDDGHSWAARHDTTNMGHVPLAVVTISRRVLA